MSRIGLKVIKVPAGVEVKLEGDLITVKGPKGTNHVTLPLHITLDQSHEGEIHVKRDNELKQTKQSHGATLSLIHISSLITPVPESEKLLDSMVAVSVGIVTLATSS